jgi:hypothetical protein
MGEAVIVVARHRVRPFLEARSDLRVDGRRANFRFGLLHADFITANRKTTNAGALQICTVLEIPVSSLFEGAPGSSPFEGGMSQDVIDFMESEEGVRVVAAFSRIADRKVRRGIVRLAGRIANHVQPKASAELLQFKAPAEVPAGNT